MEKQMIKKKGFEYGKIYVFYDEIYDTYIKENKKKNYFEKKLKFPNPSVLIIKVLSELYNLKDKIEYISCSSFKIVNTYSYYNGQKRSIYETLLILHSISSGKRIETQAKPTNTTTNTTNTTTTTTNTTNTTTTTTNTTTTTITKTSKSNNAEINHSNNNNYNYNNTEIDIQSCNKKNPNLLLFHILNDLNDIYEYFLYIDKNCYKNYTCKFFINLSYNIVKKYLKLQYMNVYVSKKFKNISFDYILNKFIKLLNIFSNELKLGKNFLQIECVIFFVYFYVFLNVPLYIYPWSEKGTMTKMNKKIFKDGNMNMIIYQIQDIKHNFFRQIILNNTVNTLYSNSYEVYDFNMAILINNAPVEKNNNFFNWDNWSNFNFVYNTDIFTKGDGEEKVVEKGTEKVVEK
ncbi:conserved protein, unknown function, partial [Hepatocystis sp. ex Piliocolobus tephrosceles]